MDVVVGYIEPHTRPDTLALLEGLCQLPPLEIPYKGITLREFDLDSAIKRKPRLILVDELAHTNAENCRHSKEISGYPGASPGRNRCLYYSKCTASGEPERYRGIHNRCGG